AVVRAAQAKRTAIGRRVEAQRRVERAPDELERLVHRADQGLGPRGGHERRALADEQRVVEEPAQPAERVAHARLAEPDALRRARDAALAEQGVERDEQ